MKIAMKIGVTTPVATGVIAMVVIPKTRIVTMTGIVFTVKYAFREFVHPAVIRTMIAILMKPVLTASVELRLRNAI